jgi:hypothetical protein
MDAVDATTIHTDNCARPHGDTDAMASSNYTVDENHETSASEPIATHATKDVAVDTEVRDENILEHTRGQAGLDTALRRLMMVVVRKHSMSCTCRRKSVQRKRRRRL